MDLSKFTYSVIYSFDTVNMEEEDIEYYKPPRVDELWDQTEGDECGDFTYLEGWEEGYHRKYVGILSYAEFCEFIDDLGLRAEDVETGGSLGAPGLGYGISPAVSFAADGYDAVMGAYVTPIPALWDEESEEWIDSIEQPKTEEEANALWQEMRRAILNEWGY